MSYIPLNLLYSYFWLISWPRNVFCDVIKSLLLSYPNHLVCLFNMPCFIAVKWVWNLIWNERVKNMNTKLYKFSIWIIKVTHFLSITIYRLILRPWFWIMLYIYSTSRLCSLLIILTNLFWSKKELCVGIFAI